MFDDDESERYATVKSYDEIQRMRDACRLAADSLLHTAKEVRPGISTAELDRIAHEYIIRHGAVPSSLGYRGFPKSICTSVNDVVCHGIPSEDEILQEGDIINIDIAVFLAGYHGDTSLTVPVGNVDDRVRELLRTTSHALGMAVMAVRPGLRTREIGGIIDDVIVPSGFTSVHDFVGHGIGRGYHEPPSILHYRNSEPSMRLSPGMTFTIEPMVNAGDRDVYIDTDDGWTVRTRDGEVSAQYEHTILVTTDGFDVLTIPSDPEALERLINP